MSLKIHTHDGLAHADEVLAVAILLLAFPGSTVTRSRNPADYEAADIVIDVGGKYDGEKWFDHHPPLTLELRANGVPYAAAGLILRRFGAIWVKELATKHGFDPQQLVDRIDELFIQAVDAKDNGKLNLTASLKGPDVALPTNDFNSLVRMFAPVATAGESDEEGLFFQAVEMATLVLRRVAMEALGSLKADKVVRDADTGDDILVIEVGCNWPNVVVRELAHVKLVVLPKDKGGWMVCPVPVKFGVTDYRASFPEAWKGKKDEELVAVSGIPGLTLCTGTGHVLFTVNRLSAVYAARQILSGTN